MGFILLCATIAGVAMGNWQMASFFLMTMGMLQIVRALSIKTEPLGNDDEE